MPFGVSRCKETTVNGTQAFAFVAKSHSHDDIPVCRKAETCKTVEFPIPDSESGLAKPVQAEDILELQHVNYTCEENGLTWGLLGEYKPEEDFAFDKNVEIVDGKLQIICGLGGILGKVRVVFP